MLGIHRAEAAEWIELAKHAGGSVETCVGLQERVQKIDFLGKIYNVKYDNDKHANGSK